MDKLGFDLVQRFVDRVPPIWGGTEFWGQDMLRKFLSLVALLAPATAAHAGFLGMPDPHYYGPLKTQAGVGYKESVLKDGSWRVVADSRSQDGRGFSLGTVLYRAAERARDQGHPYVQILGADASGGLYGSETTIVYARGSDSPAAPSTCRGGPRTPCYTADVKVVLKDLSGPSGTEPGISVSRSQDEYGRDVVYLGFGIGAVASAHPLPGLGG